MIEGSRWRHRDTGGVIEIVEVFYNYCLCMNLKSGATIRLRRNELLQDYSKLQQPC